MFYFLAVLFFILYGFSLFQYFKAIRKCIKRTGQKLYRWWFIFWGAFLSFVFCVFYIKAADNITFFQSIIGTSILFLLINFALILFLNNYGFGIFKNKENSIFKKLLKVVSNPVLWATLLSFIVFLYCSVFNKSYNFFVQICFFFFWILEALWALEQDKQLFKEINIYKDIKSSLCSDLCCEYVILLILACVAPNAGFMVVWVGLCYFCHVKHFTQYKLYLELLQEIDKLPTRSE